MNCNKINNKIVNYHQINYFKQKSSNTIKQNNVLPDTSSKDLTLMTKTYAMTLPNFKAKALNNIDLLLEDKPTIPRVRVEILKNEDFDAKPAINAVYEIALNDQLADLLKRNSALTDNGFIVKDYKRQFDVNCSEKNLKNTLKLINEQFVNPKIQKRYIDNALGLAPVGYELHNLNIDAGFDYNDIPKNTSQKDYEEMIKNISFEDIQEYSNNILKNSDIHITLQLNKDFYNSNEKDLSSLINEITK